MTARFNDKNTRVFGAAWITNRHLTGILSGSVYHQATIRPVDEKCAEFRGLNIQAILRGQVAENDFAGINRTITIRIGKKQPAFIPAHGLAVETIATGADGDLDVSCNCLAAREIHRGYELVNPGRAPIVIHDGVKAWHGE